MTYAIPVIDLEAADAGDSAQLDAMRAATRELGALQVANHGVPAALAADLSARMNRLLSRPRAEKARLASPHPYRGWRQWPDDFGRLELERFNVAQFDDIGAARAAGLGEAFLGLYALANVWPEDDPGLREVAFGYMEACRGLAGRMLRLYARGWEVPGDTFGLGALPHLRLTVNDYPTWSYPEVASGAASEVASGAASEAADEDKLLLLEHADDSAVTVLAQEGDYDGLQIQAPDGSWIAVPVIPGALLVFSGALLARWTGGRLRPGRHRVVAGGTVTRRSTAVFVYPALDTVVAPLAPFAADALSAGFGSSGGSGGSGGSRGSGGSGGSGAEPVLVWDHVRNRVADYLAEYGRPDQIAAWHDGKPYVAELAENSAGR
jgi:flavonol synthase